MTTTTKTPPKTSEKRPPSLVRRRRIAVVLLAIPFGMVPLLSYLAVQPLASSAAREALAVGETLLPKPAPAPVVLVGDLGIGDEANIVLHHWDPALMPRPLDGERRRPQRPSVASRASDTTTVGGLIRAATVLQAAKQGLRPTGSSVPASGRRPAGLSLAGVSAPGSPLRDGDVLVRVAGAEASAEGVVVGAVAAAYEARVPAIAAEVWRRDQRMIITIELPYPKKRRKNKGTTPLVQPE